jgi:hypothetical protein
MLRTLLALDPIFFERAQTRGNPIQNSLFPHNLGPQPEMRPDKSSSKHLQKRPCCPRGAALEHGMKGWRMSPENRIDRVQHFALYPAPKPRAQSLRSDFPSDSSPDRRLPRLNLPANDHVDTLREIHGSYETQVQLSGFALLRFASGRRYGFLTAVPGELEVPEHGPQNQGLECSVRRIYEAHLSPAPRWWHNVGCIYDEQGREPVVSF